MQITVNVSDVDLTSVIGEQANYDVEGDYVGTDKRTIGDTVAAHIAADLKRDDSYNSLKKRVLDLRDEEIRAQLKPLVEAAITQPVQRTNNYGQPVGAPITLHELIVDEVQKYLTAEVGDYNRRTTRVKSFVTQAVEAVVQKELAAAIAEEKAKVIEAVRGKAAGILADAIRQGLGR